MKKMILIDGNNIMFRSYYATAASGNLMQNSQGVYTNAIYGFVNAFQQIMKLDFTHILVALDAKGKTFRHDMYPDYKGTRKDTPLELITQFPLMREYLAVARIPYTEFEKYEADDIIGYFATHFKDEFDQITIISNDHDLLQLLDQNVNQLISKKGFTDYSVYTPDKVVAELGIRPDQMTDFKGLVGDSSDNIPGVPGIGPKTAAKLLSEYNDLETILDRIDDFKGKLKERLGEFGEQARFSKKLATIVTEFQNDLPLDKLAYPGPDETKLVDFFRRMEFRSFLRRMNQAYQEPLPATAHVIVNNNDKQRTFPESPVSLHLELFGTNYHIAEKLGFALFDGKETHFLPYDEAIKSPAFLEWLQDPGKEKYVYDYKQMKVALSWDNIRISGVVFDLMLAIYLVNPNYAREGFQETVQSFGYDQVRPDEEIYGKGASFTRPDMDTIARHACDKARAIHQLRSLILEKNREYDQMDLLNDIELPLADILAEMEHSGIGVDESLLDEYGTDLKRRIGILEADIHKKSGYVFNINSPKQLGDILFEKLELPYTRKTKTGYSTDISVLSQLSGFHPVVDSVIEYRKLTKLLGTYYEGLKSALQLKFDSRIHTIYKQALTQTGRLSSVEPNLQNIPVKTDEGKEFRKVFIADRHHLLLSCDYSQIELRVLAEMADVKGLKHAFSEGIDVHTHTAKLIFGKDQVTENERRQAKAVNFGIIYGKTSWGLAEDLHIPPKQAEKFIADYFRSYPEIKTFMDSTINRATDTGYVSTLFHRRRYIPELKATNYQTREFGKRMAMNAPVQGSAADILKIAMVRLQKELKSAGLKTQMVLQIHDELVLSVPEAEKPQALKLVRDTMENAVEISVPLVVDATFGTNLFEVKDNA